MECADPENMKLIKDCKAQANGSKGPGGQMECFSSATIEMIKRCTITDGALGRTDAVSSKVVFVMINNS